MIREAMVPAFGYGWQMYLEKSDKAVPQELAGFFEHFSDRAPAALSALTEHDMLIHGGCGADNLFFDGDAVQGGGLPVRGPWVRRRGSGVSGHARFILVPFRS